ncbi:MAG: 4Fe-4S dicluster domain-containing protein [Chloroflexi bacterium]|nr:4Fe-4S dicluster domain-containing protein [Chloroflexota bacterium]
MAVTIDSARCTGCTTCVQSCPSDVLRMKGGKAVATYVEDCTNCFTCELDCTRWAIRVVPND